MPGNKSPTAPNLWTQSTRTKQPWSHTICTLQGLSQLHPTAPSWQIKLPSMWFPLFQMWQNGTLGTQMPCGGKPLQPRNAPPPGSQQRKSRCPPRNHNHCQGQKNKTDTIDVREDHSPQDEIALHYIQPNTTTWNTHPKEIMVGDVHAAQCNEAYTTIQLPASASRKGTASLHVKVDTGVGGNVLPLHVFRMPIPRSDQSSWPTHWPRPCQYQTHCIQWIPYTSIWCTLQDPSLGNQITLALHSHRVKSYWYIADTPGPTILGLPSSEKLAVVKMNCAITVRQPCTHPPPVSTTVATNKPATAPEAAKPHQVHWWLDQGIPRLVPRHWPIPWWIQNLTPSWCTSCDTCPQEMPHCLTSKDQRAPQQDGMPRCDHPCRQTNRLGILHYLCPEGQWQAMPVLGSPWPQWGHLSRSSQDANHGRSCSWVHTLPLLH